jgi:hypothetical protein
MNLAKYLSRILMRGRSWSIIIPALLIVFFEGPPAFSQLENVPVTNPVYDFLKRMEVKKIISGYYSVVLPISREEVAGFLAEIERHRDDLSPTDQGILDDLKVEFGPDMGLGTANEVSLLSGESSFSERFGQIFSEKEKYLYTYRDTSNSFYLSGLGFANVHYGRGDTWDRRGFFTWISGPRFRGTWRNRLGYFLQVTYWNTQGNRAFASSFPEYQRSSKFQRGQQSFEVTEGYLRVAAGPLDIQVGRERFLWGKGYNSKLIVSDNASVMDFARVDATIGRFRYTFFHTWLLGQEKLTRNPYSGYLDSSIEPKYLAANRIELSVPKKFNVGLGEAVIYSRRSIDLAYLNPVNFFKTIEPEFHNRDNALVTGDFSIFPASNWEVYGGILVDDIEWGKLGSDYFGNKIAYNLGFSYIEPADIKDTDVTFEYTKIDPYVYTHVTAENSYTHDQRILGDPLGPNSESLWLRWSYRPTNRIRVSLEAARQRHGDNIYDSNGNLVKNVGGDVLYGKRLIDSNDSPFLDGILLKTYRVALKGVYEFVNEWFVDVQYEYRSQKNVALGRTSNDHLVFFQIRFDI